MASRASARVIGLLLAAGSGRRFDPAAPGRKLEQLIDGRSVAAHALHRLRESCDAVLVAVRSLDAAIVNDASALALDVLVPPQAALGMGHSLAALAGAVGPRYPQAESLVVALADMPWIAPATVRTLLAASHQHDAIAQPVFAGQSGHPVVFPARYLDALAACRGDIGARALLQQYSDNVLRVPVQDAGVLRDIDTVADLPPG